jgi:hypothetical protein
VTAEVEADQGTTEDGSAYYGRVIIEWPEPPERKWHSLVGWRCAVLDAETGKPVITVSKITLPAITADARGWITCELTMFADDDGMPVLSPGEYPGRPGSVKIYMDGDGNVRTGTFTFIVAEMRVRPGLGPVVT